MLPAATSSATEVRIFFSRLSSVCLAIMPMALTIGIPDFKVMENWEHIIASDLLLTFLLPSSMVSSFCIRLFRMGFRLLMTGYRSRI